MSFTLQRQPNLTELENGSNFPHKWYAYSIAECTTRVRKKKSPTVIAYLYNIVVGNETRFFFQNNFKERIIFYIPTEKKKPDEMYRIP